MSQICVAFGSCVHWLKGTLIGRLLAAKSFIIFCCCGLGGRIWNWEESPMRKIQFFRANGYGKERNF